jgi:hypothetical protein
LASKLCGGVISERPVTRTIKAGSETKAEEIMMFTGTLIDDLFATVERAEQVIDARDFVIAESLMSDSWFASVQENAEFDSKLIEVA